jgi:signal transduction histidine kinase
VRTAGGARAWLAVAIGAGFLAPGCATETAPGAPRVVFERVPSAEPGGTSKLADIGGRVVNPRAGLRVVLYARSGDWYVQPFWETPFTEIRPDSTWASPTHTGTEYAALLVDPRFTPPRIAAALPSRGGGVVAVEVVPGTPVFWRRRSFLLALAATAVVAGVGLHVVRVRDLTRQLHLRAEERLAERTRIAQSLYDTLLQGLLGASLQLHAAVEDLPEHSPQRARFASALATMREAGEEGRKVLQGLRGVSADEEELDQALRRLGPENTGAGPAFRVDVSGTARPLHPIIQEEVFGVCREALANAFSHARATAVEVEVQYRSRALRIVVRDDGCGIRSYRAARAAGSGLCRMQSRADAIGARLRVRSRPGAGTVIDVSVPGGIAYTAGGNGRETSEA